MSRKKQEPMTHRYYMLNKSVGCVCACRDAEHRTVLELLPPEEREGLFPVGRLDKNTEGLLLLTDDGKLNRQLLAPENHAEKEYLLWAAGALTEEWESEMERGMVIRGVNEPLRPVKVAILATTALGQLPVEVFENRRALVASAPNMPAFLARLTLTEGKRHQIKRMMEAAHCTVVYLKRISFAGLWLDDALQPGEHRPLTEQEIRLLYEQNSAFHSHRISL